jgi:hypothetical protein
VARPSASQGRGIRRAAPILLLLGTAAVIAVAQFVAGRDDAPTAHVPSPSPSIVVGTPGGAVLASTPEPTQQPTPEPTPQATPEPTPEPIPTPQPTPPHTASPTPQPATATPATPLPATAAPTPIVVAVADPADAVAAFYGNVVAGDFDAAYSLWSDRMRTTFPREGNLDDRFAETDRITFSQLEVVERTATTATVQANFTETYESGASRQFIGYWELVLVNGRWLLDEPHY